MSRFGRFRFWLDGGYDRAEVEDCEYHPDHSWMVVRVGDIYPDTRWPDEKMVICKGCFVPRCGHSDEPNPCLLPRHHEGEHEDAEEPATQKAAAFADAIRQEEGE